VDANLAIGSIFGIYPGSGFIGRTGREQVAALYILYGPRVTLTYTTGKGVHEFTLNDVGEFTLTKENLTVAETAKNFAPGNLRAVKDNEKYKALVHGWMDGAYTLRYSGGMVPDVNHILMKGQGIFTYPPLPPKYPEGKLRLLFECNPLSFLMEQAGGLSSNGKSAILDLPIREVHQRTPIYIGSKNEVEKAIRTLA
jgi:fructose-1,6-bisphosphatase I